MSDLLDANVWVPLVAADHVHHGRALHFWQEESAGSVAFCRVTALAFLRHVTNAHIMQHGVLTSSEAWTLLQQWLNLPEVSFLSEPPGLDERLGQFSRELSMRPSLWTDAYLAAFAMAGNHRIVSFDGDFRKFRELDLLYLQSE